MTGLLRRLLEAARRHDDKAAETTGRTWWSNTAPARTRELASGINWLSWGVGVEVWMIDAHRGASVTIGPCWLTWHVRVVDVGQPADSKIRGRG